MYFWPLKKFKMKRFLLLISMLFTTTSTFAQNSGETSGNGPEISFEKTTHDFGQIPLNGNAVYEFVFTNTGNEPLIINKPKASCSCTVPDWPHTVVDGVEQGIPVNPGESSSIKVKYKTTHKAGKFNKRVTVNSNAQKNSQVILIIKGEVLGEALPTKEENSMSPFNNSESSIKF